MTNHGDTFQRVTVAEAATVLGISPATVRRMVKAGTLTGERVVRPQGSAFVVLLPEDASAARHDASGTRHDAWSVERSNASPDASQGAALAAWAVTLMAPLAEANARQHDTIERQAETIRDQAETIGRQGAELERATSTVVALGDELAAIDASRRRASRLLIAGAVLLACLAVVAGASAAMAWLP